MARGIKQNKVIAQEEKEELLLEDLCTRLPYGVYVYANGIGCYKLSSIELYKGNVIVEINEERLSYHLYEIKPYLRPMSSMTKEEIKYKLSTFFRVINTNIEGVGYIPTLNSISAIEYIDWLNKHHFDYRGLIEKGLALEAPEGMYN